MKGKPLGSPKPVTFSRPGVTVKEVSRPNAIAKRLFKFWPHSALGNCDCVCPHVSHTPMDYTAILAFIEKTFNVPPLTSRDKHWLDNGDMSDFFDFSTPALLSPPGFYR
jgi:hypothetical protein